MTLRDIRDRQHDRQKRRAVIGGCRKALRVEFSAMMRDISTLLAIVYRSNAEEVERLRQLLAERDETIAQLQAQLGTDEPMPPCLDLTSHQARILGVIVRRPVASADVIIAAIGTDSTPNAVSTQVSYLRRKLAGFGVSIRCRNGEGYWMADADKARLRALGASSNNALAA